MVVTNRTDMLFRTLARLFFIASFALTGTAHATPGGVNSQGCHESTKIGYHCHPQRATGGGGADGSRADRVKRLKAECKGGVNAGACSGYTGR